LIGLCDGWGWATTYCAATDEAPSSNRLHPIKTQIQNEDRIAANPPYGIRMVGDDDIEAFYK
jgi:hypothetical protein